MSRPAPAFVKIARWTAMVLLSMAIDLSPTAHAQIQTGRGEQQWQRAVFPLSVAAGKRYLEDAAGKPFLMHGDTAWSLIAQLTLEDAAKYLDDRSARGFNTILVNLLEHAFATKAPANIYGDKPFSVDRDFGTPTEAYFAHADRVLRMATDRGFLVLLAPAYIGYQGGNQGWYQAMVANDPEKLRDYGRYVGRRYKDFSNILWVHAGDANPPDKDRIRAVAEGIREMDTRALHTAHCAPEFAALDYWRGEPWLQVTNVYTYKSVAAAALKQYARPERLPFFLMESAYEFERRATELRTRTQAYHALLSGAFGHVYGNNPIWHFDGGGLHKAPVNWHEALNSRGAQSMTVLRRFFDTLPWWRLEPDAQGRLVTGGAGSGQDAAAAALSPDGAFALAYLPTPRKLRIDLTRLTGPKVRAKWLDPADGSISEVAGSPFDREDSHVFQPTALNSAKQSDWVLVLESESQ